MGAFEGKTGLILGVANRRSIAWAIAKRLADEGARLAFTYQGERIEKNVRELAETVDSPLVTSCDVRSDDDLAGSSGRSAEVFDGGLDLLVHSVAFAAAEDLEGRFTDTPRDRFWMAIDVSAYSLVACARAAEPLMEARGGGSIVTMTYLGGERAVPHYNVMGVAKATLDSAVKYLAWDLGEKNIRVNAISAGPVRTLPRARSPASRRWRRSSRSVRRSTGTWTRTTWARRPRTSSATTPGTSPRRRCTWTAATTPWACNQGGPMKIVTLPSAASGRKPWRSKTSRTRRGHAGCSAA